MVSMSDMLGRLGLLQTATDESEEEAAALAVVREQWPGANAEQLVSRHREYMDARNAANCSEACQGLSTCSMRGYLPVIQRLESVALGVTYDVRYAPCQHRRLLDERRRIDGALSSSQIPRRFSECSFDGYMTAGLHASVAAAKSAAQQSLGNGQGLVLCGPRGTGKTHLAAAMALTRLREGRLAVFVCVPDLLDDMRGDGRRSDDPEGEREGALCVARSAPFLVLDDLGRQRTTEWAGERLYMLINYRYSHDLQTVVTTNADGPRDLAASMGEQGEYIVSRLSEMCRWVHLQGKDHRLESFKRAGECAEGGRTR